METLQALIPDVEVLLAMAPEELAPFLLRVASKNFERGDFNPNALRPFVIGCCEGGYPDSRWEEVKIALNEAWQWLYISMLIVPAPGTMNEGWMVLTRRGISITTEQQFQQFREAAAFPQVLLHPAIADKVWLALARGDFDEAVFAAFKAVEEAVRNAGNFGPSDIGVPLMRKAFDKTTGPLSNPQPPEPERDALAHLFAGAIGSYKNPHSHRTVSI